MALLGTYVLEAHYCQPLSIFELPDPCRYIFFSLSLRTQAHPQRRSADLKISKAALGEPHPSTLWCYGITQIRN